MQEQQVLLHYKYFAVKAKKTVIVMKISYFRVIVQALRFCDLCLYLGQNELFLFLLLLSVLYNCQIKLWLEFRVKVSFNKGKEANVRKVSMFVVN